MEQIHSTDIATSGVENDLSSTIGFFIWIEESPRDWIECVRSISGSGSTGVIFIAFAHNTDREFLLSHFGSLKDVKLIPPESFNVGLSEIWDMDLLGVAFLLSPTVLPNSFLTNAAYWIKNDPRVASVSFLSNAGGFLSFPYRNTPHPLAPDGYDQTTLTYHLRARHSIGQRRGVPIPVAQGPVVVLSTNAWNLCSEDGDSSGRDVEFLLEDISLRSGRRGLVNYLDPYTFVFRVWPPNFMVRENERMTVRRDALNRRHPFYPICYDIEMQRSDSVLAQALDVARAQTNGLRILIDGSALGPKEMGTQLVILQLCKELCTLPVVQRLFLAVPQPDRLPSYAQELRNLDKLILVKSNGLEFPDADYVDIIHRPYQPSEPIPWQRWSSISKRIVITIQDLIAYRNASYFPNWQKWDDYRSNFRLQASRADAIFSISNDVVSVIQEERMPIERDRIFVVENGGDARSPDQPVRVPRVIAERGWTGRRFLVAIGATYAHKNRDFTIRVWAELRRMGFDIGLVLVGATVPFGSSRVEEALISSKTPCDSLIVLPEVESLERNWLLKHASLAMYLTSAEGFGQGPFEAACMGVPTLFVSFGPLRELLPDTVTCGSFRVDELAAQAVTLLTSRDAAQKSIATIMKSVERLSWKATAKKTVDAYFEVLDMPARAGWR
ncbi:glycosyltransferase [Nitrospirillum sp. BR 11752]|uniref:glycosyltransferase n=1 Tax=Nitrospirillum sp. BR 11752 TaxID=3104293 RepID=UPI002EB75404|nr:glycosyltransferase [Nitrospirillum sp. BR 11752]